MSDIRIELNIGDDNSPMSFHSVDDLENWFTQEKARWDWLRDLSGSQPPEQAVTYVWQQFNGLFTSIQGQIGTFRQRIGQGNPTQITQALAAVQNAFVNAYGKPTLLLAQSAKAQFAVQHRSESPFLAAMIAGVFCGHIAPQASQTPLVYEAAYVVASFNRGQVDTIAAEREALSSLRGDWQRRSDQLLGEFVELKRNYGALTASFDKMIADNGTEWVEWKKQLDEETDAIKRTYDEELALRKPVEYWTNQEERHRGSTIRALTWTKVGGGSALGVTLIFAVLLFWMFPPKDNIWVIGLVALVATFGVWTVRLITRYLLSRIHLADDAKERAVMMSAYLSLLREPKALEDKHRELILQSLFRPSTTGIIKDDGPATLFDAMSKLKGG